MPAQWLTDTLLGTVLSVLSSSPKLGPDDTVASITGLVLDGSRAPRPHDP
jgi:hypothetical protein